MTYRPSKMTDSRPDGPMEEGPNCPGCSPFWGGSRFSSRLDPEGQVTPPRCTGWPPRQAPVRIRSEGQVGPGLRAQQGERVGPGEVPEQTGEGCKARISGKPRPRCGRPCGRNRPDSRPGKGCFTLQATQVIVGGLCGWPS